jgi:hypothetical protein
MEAKAEDPKLYQGNNSLNEVWKRMNMVRTVFISMDGAIAHLVIGSPEDTARVANLMKSRGTSGTLKQKKEAEAYIKEVRARMAAAGAVTQEADDEPSKLDVADSSEKCSEGLCPAGRVALGSIGAIALVATLAYVVVRWKRR